MQVVEVSRRLELFTPLRTGARWGLALLSLFPLLAPYELLLRPRWQSYGHPLFLLAALISVGAVAVALFLLCAAVAGLSSRMVFDAGRSTFSYMVDAPILRTRRSEYPLAAVDHVEVDTTELSDGAPTYRLRVRMNSCESFESGASWSREEVEGIRQLVEAILSRTPRSSR